MSIDRSRRVKEPAAVRPETSRSGRPTDWAPAAGPVAVRQPLDLLRQRALAERTVSNPATAGAGGRAVPRATRVPCQFPRRAPARLPRVLSAGTAGHWLDLVAVDWGLGSARAIATSIRCRCSTSMPGARRSPWPRWESPTSSAGRPRRQTLGRVEHDMCSRSAGESLAITGARARPRGFAPVAASSRGVRTAPRIRNAYLPARGRQTSSSSLSHVGSRAGSRAAAAEFRHGPGPVAALGKT